MHVRPMKCWRSRALAVTALASPARRRASGESPARTRTPTSHSDLTTVHGKETRGPSATALPAAAEGRDRPEERGLTRRAKSHEWVGTQGDSENEADTEAKARAEGRASPGARRARGLRSAAK